MQLLGLLWAAFVCGELGAIVFPAHYNSVQEMLDAGDIPEGPIANLVGRGFTSFAGLENWPSPETITSLSLAENQCTEIPAGAPR